MVAFSDFGVDRLGLGVCWRRGCPAEVSGVDRFPITWPRLSGQQASGLARGPSCRLRRPSQVAGFTLALENVACGGGAQAVQVAGFTLALAAVSLSLISVEGHCQTWISVELVLGCES